MIEYTVKVDNNGNKFWYLDGKRHREDGPAFDYVNGDKCWYLHDKLHRIDGPAVESVKGYKSWFLDGKQLTETEFNSRFAKITTIDGVQYKLTRI